LSLILDPGIKGVCVYVRLTGAVSHSENRR